MGISGISIHPSIGICRVGNSKEFFIGPEDTGPPAPPPGGYKDATGAVKRQAARFHLIARHDDGSVEEITLRPGVTIEWTAALVNRKAAADGFTTGAPRNASVEGAARQGLVIDPGLRHVSGPNQVAVFDSGVFKLPESNPVSVPLGELRTDAAGRVVVVGGFGTSSSPTNSPIGDFANNDGWHDDVADGPVTATVTVDGQRFTAEPAWVIVGPPKFAPALANAVTLWDTLYQVAGLPAPSPVFFETDILPILTAAELTRWVNEGAESVHEWSDPQAPAVRKAIFKKLRKPNGSGGNMPALSGGVTLTPVQLGIMEAFRDGKYQQGARPIDLGERLDRAALGNCVGAAFFPGIEAGAFLCDPGHFVKPFRLDHAKVQAGNVGAQMALPWQADFYACNGTIPTWWPVPRPNQVIPEGERDYKAWSRDVQNYEDMVSKWSKLGFVVKDGDGYFEVGREEPTTIHLMTPSVTVAALPGDQAVAHAVFEVAGTEQPMQLEIVTPPSHPDLAATAPGEAPAQQAAQQVVVPITYAPDRAAAAVHLVEVRDPASGERWEVAISASTEAEPPDAGLEAVRTAAAALTEGVVAADAPLPPGLQPDAPSLLLSARGVVPPHGAQRLPLLVTEADDALLVAVTGAGLDVEMSSPLFARPEPEVLSADAASRVHRYDLPFEAMEGRFAHAGTWQLVLTNDGDDALPYTAIAHAASAITMDGGIETAPDGAVQLRVTVEDASDPPRATAATAVVTGPDGSRREVPVTGAGGIFVTKPIEPEQEGPHTVQVVVTGESRLGWRFRREQTWGLPSG